MNRRLVVWMLALAIAIWAVALMRTAPRAATGQKRLVSPTPSPAPEAATARVEARPPAPNARASETLQTASPPPKGGVIAPDDSYRKKLAGVIAEQRRLSAERFASADQRWPHERRAEPWATQREKALRSAMERDQIDSMISAHECRETLCRLELAAQDSNAAIAFNGAHELQLQLGKQIGSAMTGGGLDRRMILFVPRNGLSPEH